MDGWRSERTRLKFEVCSERMHDPRARSAETRHTGTRAAKRLRFTLDVSFSFLLVKEGPDLGTFQGHLLIFCTVDTYIQVQVLMTCSSRYSSSDKEKGCGALENGSKGNRAIARFEIYELRFVISLFFAILYHFLNSKFVQKS